MGRSEQWAQNKGEDVGSTERFYKYIQKSDYVSANVFIFLLVMKASGRLAAVNSGNYINPNQQMLY